MDAYVQSANFARDLDEAFEDAAKNIASLARVVVAEIYTLDGSPNVVDLIWDERPALPKNPFRVHVGYIIYSLHHLLFVACPGYFLIVHVFLST